MNKIIKNIYNITDQYFNTTYEPNDILSDCKFDYDSNSYLTTNPLKPTSSQLSIINPNELLFNDDNDDNDDNNNDDNDENDDNDDNNNDDNDENDDNDDNNNDDNDENDDNNDNMYINYYLQPNNTPTEQINPKTQKTPKTPKLNDIMNQKLMDVMYELDDLVDNLKHTEDKLKHTLCNVVQKQNQLFTNMCIICISSVLLQGLTTIIFLKK